MHMIITLALMAMGLCGSPASMVELQAVELSAASVEICAPGEPSETIAEPDAYIVDLMARTIYAEARGCSTMEQAAVAWCVLNRVDAGYGTVEEVLTAPHQFATWGGEVGQEQLDIAADVLIRWEREKAGEADVGRVLPSEYLWFTGNGSENLFRDAYEGGVYWDWSLDNPYKEGKHENISD